MSLPGSPNIIFAPFHPSFSFSFPLGLNIYRQVATAFTGAGGLFKAFMFVSSSFLIFSKFFYASSNIGIASNKILSASFLSSLIYIVSKSNFFFFCEASVYSLNAISDFSLISSNKAVTSFVSKFTSTCFF